jgi:CheY-like chemotaxis protein
MHVQHVSSEEPRVLVAEDDPHLRRLIARHLSRNGYHVLEASDGRETLEILGKLALRRTELSAIVMDVRMPGHTGMAILAGLRDRARETPILLMTAFGDAELHRRAAELGARAVLDKPFAMEALGRLVNATVEGTTREERDRPDEYAKDRMLIERYLDVVNRARAQHAFRHAGSWRPAAIVSPISIRVTGAGGASLFVIDWRAPDGYGLSSGCERTAAVRCEVGREHAEAVIASPWRYIAHPHQLALWFLIHGG